MRECSFVIVYNINNVWNLETIAEVYATFAYAWNVA